MSINHLKDVPGDWVEKNMDKLVKIYEAIKNIYWVSWQGGYAWKAGIQKPINNRYHTEWHRPSLEQVIERQAIFDGVHRTEKRP